MCKFNKGMMIKLGNVKLEINSLKVKTASGLIWSVLDLVFNQGINFIVQIILARLLLPEDFGTIAIISVFIGISSAFVDSGFTNALIRENDVTEEEYSTVFYFNLAISIVMYIVLFILAPTISIFFDNYKLKAMIRILSLGIIFNSIELTQRVMLIKKLDFKTQTKVSIIASTLSGIVGVIVALNGFGAWSLVIRALLMYVIQASILCIFNRWKPALIFDIDSFKRLFGFGWKMLISGLIDTLYNNIYYVIIGKKFSAVDLGYYTNAAKLSEPTYSIITKAIEKVSFPILSKISNDDKLRNAYRIIFKNTVFIALPIMLGLSAIGEPLIMIILGSNWANSIVYFQMLCVAGIGFPVGVINLNILQIKGRSDLFLRLEIIKKTILVITIAVVLIFRLGIMGLLWGTLINTIIGYFINSYYSKDLISYSTLEQIKDIKNTVIISIIMTVIVYSIGVFFTCGNCVKILVQVLVGVSIYFLGNKLIKSEELNTIFELLLLLLKREDSKKEKS